MAELKTQANKASVDAFLAGVADENRRKDGIAVCKLMAEATGEKPVMWGSAIIGFGTRTLKYDSGRELEWMLVGFSPRKANTVFYLSQGYPEYAELMARLGKYKTGKSCLYINKLADVDLKVLKELVKRSARHARQ